MLIVKWFCSVLRLHWKGARCVVGYKPLRTEQRPPNTLFYRQLINNIQKHKAGCFFCNMKLLLECSNTVWTILHWDLHLLLSAEVPIIALLLCSRFPCKTGINLSFQCALDFSWPSLQSLFIARPCFAFICHQNCAKVVGFLCCR